MRKLKLLLLLGLAYAYPLSAQDNADAGGSPLGNIRWGVRAGAVVSWFSQDQPYTGQRIGFMAGGVVSYPFSEKIAVQIEPSYLQQGGSLLQFSDNTRFGDTSPYSVYATQSSITMHNIDIPLLAKYQLPELAGIQLNVVLGPAIAFTAAATENYQRTYYINQYFTTFSGHQTVTSQYEKYQVGATGGLGTEFAAGGKRIMVDLRYRYGITPAKKGFSYIDYAPVQGDLRTHSVYFSVGVGF